MPRRWSGPIEKLGDDERRSLIDSVIAQERPRIDLDEALTEGWFEIWYQPTEDQIVRDIRLPNEIAKRLHVNGIKIAIDGFGAGYSLLSSLRELPFAELKLDHSFVRNCATRAPAAEAAASVVSNVA